MKTPCLILALIASVAPAFAVDPPPDGGYPNKNTAEGEDALFSLTTGLDNTAVGFQALYNTTNGTGNEAIGDSALFSNTKGTNNMAMGTNALYSNTTGFYNTAIGGGTLYSNTTGFFNIAIGEEALGYNSTGQDNIAIGPYAGQFSAGSLNIAVGFFALYSVYGTDPSASYNIALGIEALVSNTSGANNVATGYKALGDNATGNNNIALGTNAGLNLTTGDNNIDIGNEGTAAEANTIRIGTAGTQTSTYIAGISAAPLTHGAAVAVGITTDGQLGVRASSARFKEAIKPMDKASEAILSLQPVSFRYKKALDPKATPQFGLVAEEVAKVDPDLVAKDDQGKPFTVRYEEVNAMLLNEFLKEHKKVEEQETRLTDQTKEIAELKAALKQQSEQMQDFAARLKANGL
jgi:trimeric autotransporter adhesin